MQIKISERALSENVNKFPIPPRQSKHTRTNILQHSPPSEVFLPSQINNNTNRQLNYVSLDLQPNPKNPYIHSQAPIEKTNYSKIVLENSQSPNQQQYNMETPTKHEKYTPINLNSHTPEKKSNDGHLNAYNYNGNESNKYKNQLSSNEPNEFKDMPYTRNLCDYAGILGPGATSSSYQTDISDSIREYNMPSDAQLDIIQNLHYQQHNKKKNISEAQNTHRNDAGININFEKLSPEKYDYIMGNQNCLPQDSSSSGKSVNAYELIYPTKMNESFLRNDAGLPNNGSVVLHTDQIKTLKDLGLPPDEIQEIDRRLEQEIRDEELARKLQEQESVELDQEEKDRLMAMEAQDKELARMLQERVNSTIKKILIVLNSKYLHFLGKSKGETC